MNNLNYSYSSPNSNSFPSFSSQYSSTPASTSSNNNRFQRPRFAYAGPPSYPRPRSSASKPNPDPYPDTMQNDNFGGSPRQLDALQEVARNYPPSYSDSMRNNYGDSTLHLGDSLSMSNTRDSYGNSYLSSNSSYYTGNESFQASPQKTSLLPNYQSDSAQYNFTNPVPYGGSNSPQTGTYFNSKPDGLSSALGLSGTSTRGAFGSRGTGRGNFRGRFQKKKPRGGGMQQGGGGTQQTFGTTGSSSWRCAICAIDFTSSVPLEMHLNGAKHAKKLKSQNILRTIKGQTGQVKEIEKPDGKKFVCELCNVILNSSLQLQMHLEGTKHKTKLNPPSKEGNTENKGATESKGTGANKIVANLEVLNGKTNGGIVRSAPDELEGPKPSKMAKFACDICNIIVNSEVQLTQHLTSKKHQAKVEGKPIVRKRKPKEENGEQQSMDQTDSQNEAKTELTNVVGVKTLSSSFVQGGTLQ